MRSRTLQTYALGLVVLALTAMAAGEALADPAARNKWVSDDFNLTFEPFSKGEDWTVTWKDLKNNAVGIKKLALVKTTDTEKVFKHKDEPPFSVTLSAGEAVIVVEPTEKAAPPAGRYRGSWR